MKKNTFDMIAAALAVSGTLAMPLAHAEATAPTCLVPAAWTALEQTPARSLPAAEVLAGMAQREVVLLGETHDDDDHHRWQMQTLAVLHAHRPNMVIGFEMFPRRMQATLDRWIAGELTLKQFLERPDWATGWSTVADLYVPLFEFARINRIPMVALNVDSTLTRAIREKGLDEVPESEREGVGRPAAPPDAYLDFLFDSFSLHAGTHGAKGEKPSRSDRGFRNFIQSQTTWDRAMAEALAKPMRADQAAERPLMVGIMGSGHVRYGHGVPHQLRDLGVKNIGTLLAISANSDCKDIQIGLADAVFGLPQQAMEKPEPPRLGVRLEEKDGGVRISEVTAASLAEQTGLKAGDRVLEIGGVAVAKGAEVAAAIRRPPAGSWLPIRLKRGDETLDLIIKFPVKS